MLNEAQNMKGDPGKKRSEDLYFIILVILVSTVARE